MFRNIQRSDRYVGYEIESPKESSHYYLIVIELMDAFDIHFSIDDIQLTGG